MTALGALVYFMPNFRTITPEKCMFGSAMPCMGARLTDNNLTVVLQNGMAQNIYNISVNSTIPVVIRCAVNSTTLRADQKLMVVCNNSVGSNLGVSADSRIKLKIMYKKSVDGYYQTIDGDIYAKYE
jgi:hypothetical protein